MSTKEAGEGKPHGEDASSKCSSSKEDAEKEGKPEPSSGESSSSGDATAEGQPQGERGGEQGDKQDDKEGESQGEKQETHVGVEKPPGNGAKEATHGKDRVCLYYISSRGCVKGIAYVLFTSPPPHPTHRLLLPRFFSFFRFPSHLLFSVLQMRVQTPNRT
jgi:hypothetical protein